MLNLPAPLWALEKSVNKSAPAKKAANPRVAKKPAAQAADYEIGKAEIVESELSGLHGTASFYGQGFHGRPTATGERFDSRGFTAASNRFPLGSWVAVRRLDNNLCAVVKVNDRMRARHRKRIIDVSRGVAEYLDMIRSGVVLVRVAPLKGGPRGDASCHAAFVEDDPGPEPELLRPWTPSLSPPQLDAMQ